MRDQFIGDVDDLRERGLRLAITIGVLCFMFGVFIGYLIFHTS